MSQGGKGMCLKALVVRTVPNGMFDEHCCIPKGQLLQNIGLG